MLQQNLWTACITPFTENGSEVSYIDLEKILRQQEENKNGILLLGSTAEALSLSAVEQRDILKFACKLNLSVPIMVGVPSYNLKVALDWLYFCEQMPIDAYLMATPMYTKPGAAGQTQWFKTLLSSVQKPVMLYNIPGRTGVSLHTDTVKNIRDISNFVAIKDSSGSLNSMLNYREVAPHIEVYCGDDPLVSEYIQEKALGLVSVLSNAWPCDTHNYVHEMLAKNNKQNIDWPKICQVLSIATNPIAIKLFMQQIGIINHATVRLPLSLHDANINRLNKLANILIS